MKIKTLCALTLMVILFSCKKNDEVKPVKPDDVSNSYRLKSITIDTDNVFLEDFISSKEVFLYDGESLTEIIQYAENPDDTYEMEIGKKQFAYTGNTITETNYRNDYNTWEIAEKNIYTMGESIDSRDIRIGFKTKKAMYNEDDEEIGVFSYEYTTMNEHVYKYMYDENSVLEAVVESVWQDGKYVEVLDRAVSGGHWLGYPYYKKDTLVYSGDKLDYIIKYIVDDNKVDFNKKYKITFEYTGDKVSVCQQYTWDESNNNWDLDKIHSYTYDEKGLLIKKTINDDVVIKYEYEKGKGNADLLLIDPAIELYGNPMDILGVNAF